MTFAEWGKPPEAEALYAERLARSRRSYVQSTSLVVAAAAAGIEEEVIRHAREAVRVREPNIPLVFSKYWFPAVRLRKYPRFLEIVAAAGME